MYTLRMVALVGVLGSLACAFAYADGGSNSDFKACVDRCDSGLTDCTTQYQDQPQYFPECNRGQVDCVKSCRQKHGGNGGGDSKGGSGGK